MFGSSTIDKRITSSMCNVSCESGNQNIFFITLLLVSLCGRFIIFCNMSMMSSLVFFLLVRISFVSRTICGIVSYLITSITSELSFIAGRMLTFRIMMMAPFVFLGLNCESLIFTSHIFFSSCYLRFFL